MIEKFLNSLLAFVFCSMIIAMGAVTWDSLAKNQTDPTLITEAISAAIAAHNADPEAHMASGQAIDLHRVNEVLDHPAQSIVSDKLSSVDRFLSFPFTPNYDSSIFNYSNFFNGAMTGIEETSPKTGDSLASWVNYLFSDLGYSSGDILVDFLLSPDFGSGTAQGEFNVLFAKVQVKNGYYRLGYYTTSWQYGSWVAYSANFIDRWRIFFSSTDGVIYFYLNGLQIGSFTATPAFDSGDYMFNVLLNRGTSGDATLWFGGVQVGFSS